MSADGVWLVRWAQLPIPMQVTVREGLLFAEPRSAFTRFATAEEAEAAVEATVALGGATADEFVVWTVGDHEASLMTSGQRRRLEKANAEGA